MYYTMHYRMTVAARRTIFKRESNAFCSQTRHQKTILKEFLLTFVYNVLVLNVFFSLNIHWIVDKYSDLSTTIP